MEVLASLQIPWIIKGKSGDSLDNSMSTNLITQMKQTNSLKDSNCQNSQKKKQTIKEIESLINNLPKKKTSGPDGFLVNFTEHLRNKLCQLPTISFRRQKQREYFTTHETRITLIPNPDKNITIKQNDRLSPLRTQMLKFSMKYQQMEFLKI